MTNNVVVTHRVSNSSKWLKISGSIQPKFNFQKHLSVASNLISATGKHVLEYSASKTPRVSVPVTNCVVLMHRVSNSSKWLKVSGSIQPKFNFQALMTVAPKFE